MSRTVEYRTALVLAAALAGTSLLSGCVVRDRVYEHDHSDHWDSREDAAYRRYLEERHREYRDFNRLNAEERHDYWDWRSRHPD